MNTKQAGGKDTTYGDNTHVKTKEYVYTIKYSDRDLHRMSVLEKLKSNK